MKKVILPVIRETAAKHGGLGALGRKLGVKYQTFAYWTRIPTERVKRFSELSGIPPEKLRPDLAEIFK